MPEPWNGRIDIIIFAVLTPSEGNLLLITGIKARYGSEHLSGIR
jgi:hypothetical protein